MDILNIILQNFTNIEQNNILEILKTGSSIFGRENLKDIDYIIIVDGFENEKEKHIVELDGIKYDFWIYDKLFYYKELTFQVKNPSTYYNFFYIISERIYGTKTFEWNIFEYREKYLEVIKKTVYNFGFNPKLKYSFQSYKQHAGAYIVLKFFETNSTELTQEMIDNINIIYNNGHIEFSNYLANLFGFTLQEATRK